MTRQFTSNNSCESPSNRFQAFEFNADDEAVEKQSAKMINKIRNLLRPKNTKKIPVDSPVTKYNFLRCFAPVQKKLDKDLGNEPIDVDAGGTTTPRTKIRTLALDDDSRVDVCDISDSSSHQKKQVCTISDDDDRLEMRDSTALAFGGYEIVETSIGDHLESKDYRAAGNENKGSEQEAIDSLDVRYGDIGNLDFDFSKPFEDVIYPQGGEDAVCISKRDIELLQPETFINDTIVDFYIQYLKSKIKPEESHRFHFFNSFFYRKLADLDKDQSSEGKAALQRVLKWTRKVNVFEKDYIFIPVNYSLHWSLIVICHPGEVANVKDDDEIESSPKVPCILHMDSIKGSHRGLKKLVQRYLCEEWKERHGETAEDEALKFLRFRFVALELPQQENSFDCGLFLLHYVERFLDEAPEEFSPFKIRNFSKFLTKNWFRPAQASVKRFLIKKLIWEILEDHSREALIADCNNQHPSSQGPNQADEQETGNNFPVELSGSTKKVNGNSSSSPPMQIAARNLSLMSPLKEVEDTGDEIADSPIDLEDCLQDTGSASDSPPNSYLQKGLGISETSLNHGFLKHNQDNVNGNSVSQTSSDGSQNSSAAEIDDCSRKTNKFESSSEDFTNCVVLDSQEEDDDEVKYLASSLGNQPSVQQETDSTENSEDPESESAEQQAPKRLRLTRGMRKLHL